MVEHDRLNKLMQPVDLVLTWDFERAQREDETKRVALWNEIESCESAVQYEFSGILPDDVREEVGGRLAFAKLRLAAAARANDEDTSIIGQFSPQELDLVQTYDLHNRIDVLSSAEMADIPKRLNIRQLVMEYRQEYSRLDSVLDSSTRKDLKSFLKKRWSERLDKIDEAVKQFVGKFGPAEAVGRIEESALQAARESKAQARNSQENKGQDSGAKNGPGDTGPHKATRYITGDDARRSELGFIARFDTKMNTLPLRLFSPIDGKSLQVRRWNDGTHLSFAERGSLDSPRNQRSVYTVYGKKRGPFGGKPKRLVVEAASFGHLEEFDLRGYDDKPASLPDLLGIASRLIEQAELGQYVHVIGIGSPSGWDRDLTEHFKSSNTVRNYVSRFVSFCLVDTVTGDLFYDESDERIARFVDLFRLEFDRERVAKVAQYVLDRLLINGYAVLDDVVVDTAEARHIVNKVFLDLEREGKGNTRYVKDVGITLQSER